MKTNDNPHNEKEISFVDLERMNTAELFARYTTLCQHLAGQFLVEKALIPLPEGSL